MDLGWAEGGARARACLDSACIIRSERAREHACMHACMYSERGARTQVLVRESSTARIRSYGSLQLLQHTHTYHNDGEAKATSKAT